MLEEEFKKEFKIYYINEYLQRKKFYASKDCSRVRKWYEETEKLSDKVLEEKTNHAYMLYVKDIAIVTTLYDDVNILYKWSQ